MTNTQSHEREEISQTLAAIEFGVVATLDEGRIKSRAMHFAVDADFNFYLATLKHDPKVGQMLANKTVSLLLIKGDQGFFEAKEVEVLGQAQLLQGEEQRRQAFELLLLRSPVVKNLKEGKALDLLAVIKVQPQTIKYRVVPEVLRGLAPTVLDFTLPQKSLNYYQGWEGWKRQVSAWITELRVPFFTATVIPVTLGAVIAWANYNLFHWGYFLLTMLGVVLLHAGTNVINDYFDHQRGADEINQEFVRPFSGGSRMIQNGLLKPQQVLSAALLCFGLGSVIGWYLAWVRGLTILILGMIGVFSGFFYSAPPLRLSDHGIGEAVVGINFGILVTLGSYFVQTQTLAWEPVLAALPISFLIAAVLYLNQFPDYTADKAVGKNNLVVRLGKDKAVWGYMLIMSLAFISALMLVLLGLVSPFILLIALLLPRALRAVRLARLNFNQTLYLIPANVDTILCHLYAGLLISLAYVLQKLILG